MKVLFVDDNLKITEMVIKFLTAKGIQCSAINDPRMGLAAIQKEKFDTIFLDLAMPEFSGFDIINALENDNVLKSQNIILYTASSISDIEIDKLLAKDGVNLCLKKPAPLKDILEVINS